MKIIKHDLPQFDTLEIYPLADVHIGDPLHDKKRAKQFINEVLEKENRYVIVNGDIINNAVKHGVSDVYAEELTPNQQIEETVNLLNPIKDRILVITEGNHENRTYKQDGILIMYQVAQRLGIFDCYSEGAYLLFVKFGKSQGRDCRKMPYAIYGKHGSGGGRKVGAKAIRLFEMAEVIDADIFIHSHTHVPMVLRKTFFRVDYRNEKATQIEQIFINTNGFLNFGGYGEEKGFAPTSTKYPKIILNGIEREVKALI
ncbi:metallophosphoesterase [Tepidimicrobium xylanilyticum]